MITVEPTPFSVTLDELYVATGKSLAAEGVNSVEIVSRRAVAGQPAYIMSYLDSTASGMISIRHAIFVTPGKAWHVILLAAPSITSELDRAFNTMLDSFEFKATAFPVQ